LSDVPLIDGAHGLTPEWLTLALGLDGAQVVAAELAPVGTGQVADTMRVSLTWEAAGAGPATVVAKVTAADEASRNAALMTRTYEIEAAFYNQLADRLGVRTPRCHHAAFDAATVSYVILMDDLAPAQQGDQIAGCTVDEAHAAVGELVELHAPLWGDESLAELAWLQRHTDPESMLAGASILTMLSDGFRERYADRLDPDVDALLERFIPRINEHFADRDQPWTVAHSDYRLDNLLFGPDGEVTVVDWQTVTYGPGLADLSYFIGASLDVEGRRAEEERLVRGYAERMTAAGVPLTFDHCWTEYRRHAFSGLTMALLASMVVTRTDRGDDMFMAMANRHGRQALDLESEKLIPS